MGLFGELCRLSPALMTLLINQPTSGRFRSLLRPLKEPPGGLFIGDIDGKSDIIRMVPPDGSHPSV